MTRLEAALANLETERAERLAEIDAFDFAAADEIEEEFQEREEFVTLMFDLIEPCLRPESRAERGRRFICWMNEREPAALRLTR